MDMRVTGAALDFDQAAMNALSIPLDYMARGTHLGLAALAGQREFIDMAHHPRRDAVDRASSTRFYYHAHSVLGERLPEHGHFHLFHENTEGFSHLAALSMDSQGNPRAWMLTNQWVTGERWLSTSHWQVLLPAFKMQVRGRLAPVARWLSAMVRLYQRELLDLLAERDAWLSRECAAGRSPQEVWNDRQIHVVCQRPLALGEDLAQRLAQHTKH